MALSNRAMAGNVSLPWSRLHVSATPAAMIPWVVAFALVARVAVRLWSGETAFLENGYSLYQTLAVNLLNGTGLCLAPGVECALRVPLYPLFMAPFVATGWTYPGLAIAQAVLGAGLVWLTWRIGRDLFGDRTGLVAAILVAINPYALVHDTGMQDTVLTNVLVLLAAALLLRTRRDGAPGWCVAGGLVLAGVVLTSARMALLVPAVLAWALIGAGPSLRVRVRSAALIALPVALLVGGWVARNWSLVGAPVLTTESGESLWVANNAFALAHYPAESIDLSVRDSYQSMTPDEHAAFARVEGDELARDRLLRDWAVAGIVAHPLDALGRAASKLGASLCAGLSPARGPVLQWGYALLFLPVHLLAIAGMWRHRRDWRVHALWGAVLAAFAITTAAFWAHTSHKSHLDAFLFVYAAAAFRPGGRVSS